MKRSAVLLLLLIPILGCTSTSEEPAEKTPGTEQVPEDGMHYSGRVDFEPDAGTLSADVTVKLLISAEEAAVDFLLNRELAIESVEGKGVLGFSSEPMAPGADWDRVSVELDSAPEERWLDLRFLYAGAPIFPENGINQISTDWVELSVDAAWHPLIAAIDREFTVSIDLGLPPDWDIVSSAESTPLEDGYRLTNDIVHADIAFVAAPGLEKTARGAFTVFHRGASEATTNAVLEGASRCRTALDQRFGAGGKLPTGRFVITDRREGGYARKNFIALTDVSEDEETDLTTFLCHELSHYWSSGAKPLTVDNWLNEGFAVFVATRVASSMFGDQLWHEAMEDWQQRSRGQGSIWTPATPERRSYEINYKKGPLALARLEQEIGTESFDRLLIKYMTERINDTQTLLDTLEAETDAEARRWFELVLAEDDSSEEI